MPQDAHVWAPEFRTCRNGQGRRRVGSLIAGLDESVSKASGCSAAALADDPAIPLFLLSGEGRTT